MNDDIVYQLREHPVELLRCECARCLAADEIELMRMVIDQLGEALKTCRPWIDDFEQGDLALEEWDKFRRG